MLLMAIMYNYKVIILLAVRAGISILMAMDITASHLLAYRLKSSTSMVVWLTAIISLSGNPTVGNTRGGVLLSSKIHPVQLDEIFSNHVVYVIIE